MGAGRSRVRFRGLNSRTFLITSIFSTRVRKLISQGGTVEQGKDSAGHLKRSKTDLGERTSGCWGGGGNVGKGQLGSLGETRAHCYI